MNWFDAVSKKISYWAKIYWPGTIGPEIIASALIGILILVSMSLHRRFVASTNTNEDPSQKHLRHVAFRNRMAFLYLMLLFFIWAGEIRSLLLSLAAVAAALLLVSKELIANILGGLVFTFSKPAQVGDMVSLSTHHGRLMDVSWFYLTVQEFSAQHTPTGRTLRIPNNFLLTGQLVVESNSPISIHSCTLTVETAFAHSAKTELRRIASELLDTHQNAIVEYLSTQPAHLQQSGFFPSLGSTWSVYFQPKDHAGTELTLQFYAPSAVAASIKQELIGAFYDWYGRQIQAQALPTKKRSLF